MWSYRGETDMTKLDVTNLKTGKGGMGVAVMTMRNGVEVVKVIAAAKGFSYWPTANCAIKPWGAA